MDTKFLLKTLKGRNFLGTARQKSELAKKSFIKVSGYIMKNSLAGHVGCMGETRNGYQIFAEDPEGKKLFGYGQTEE
jgi:hypothetical protein